MPHRFSLKSAGLVVVAGMLAAAASLQAAPAPVAEDCKVTTTDSILVKAGAQDIKVKVTEDLGGEITAKFADESKIKVTSVAKDAEANTLKLTIETGEAVAGEWALTVSAGEASCKGDLKVSAAVPSVRG